MYFVLFTEKIYVFHKYLFDTDSFSYKKNHDYSLLKISFCYLWFFILDTTVVYVNSYFYK